LARQLCVIACGVAWSVACVAGPDLARAQQPGGCARTEFETAVDDAAGALRDLNARNKPPFQEKLRELKEKRGWTTEQFLQEAAPFVQDERITQYDQATSDLLDDINRKGEAGSLAKSPDCQLLSALKASMTRLIEMQGAKWAYMFQKLEAAIKP
jgi:hypothetical protein